MAIGDMQLPQFNSVGRVYLGKVGGGYPTLYRSIRDTPLRKVNQCVCVCVALCVCERERVQMILYVRF